MEELRPNEKRAKNAITLIWIILALEVISLASGYMQYNLLNVVADGGEISIEEANANDLREQIIGIIYIIATIISAVTFIQWFRRAYYNLHTKITYLAFAEGWAAGSWFVPFINLYRPLQIMKELYNETKELLTEKGLIYNTELSTSALGWWWGLWILSGILGQIVFRLSLNAETLDEIISLTLIGIGANIVGIPLALIAIKVIKDYAKVEPLLSEATNDSLPDSE